MQKIKIFCMSCNSHILDTDAVRLHFPLSGEMFDPVVKNLTMRPGYLNLDYFCPICGACPWYADGSRKGFRGVGRFLKTLDTTGKVKMMEIADIVKLDSPQTIPEVDPTDRFKLEKKLEIMRQITEEADEPEEVLTVPEWPCPLCGAKAKIHKKGCALKKPVLMPEQDDTILQSLISQVENNSVDPDAPPTPAEIAELARDREYRASSDKQADTRPYSGR